MARTGLDASISLDRNIAVLQDGIKCLYELSLWDTQQPKVLWKSC